MLCLSCYQFSHLEVTGTRSSVARLLCLALQADIVMTRIIRVVFVSIPSLKYKVSTGCLVLAPMYTPAFVN